MSILTHTQMLLGWQPMHFITKNQQKHLVALSNMVTGYMVMAMVNVQFVDERGLEDGIIIVDTAEQR